jgi:hypothetical protein
MRLSPPHIHYLVPGGALCPDGKTWIATGYKDRLLPVKALCRLFRGKSRAPAQEGRTPRRRTSHCLEKTLDRSLRIRGNRQ